METQALSTTQYPHLFTEEFTFLEQTKLYVKRKSSNRFKLPLEKGSWKLTREMLNCYSGFRRLDKPYLKVRIRKIDYQKEVLVIGVSIANEAEEKVYIQVQSDHLLIACSMDTDESYLSRYAYHALEELISASDPYDFERFYYSGFFDVETGESKYLDIAERTGMDINSGDHFDFERFYWPGFFDVETGKSKYLDITERRGMDINLKFRYSPFFKPGQRLYYPLEAFQEVSRPRIAPAVTNLSSEEEIGVGYCVADTYLTSSHSNHWPFLIPYTLVPTKSREKVRSFIDFLKEKADLPVLDYPTAQRVLNGLCYQMMALAPIASVSRLNTETEKEQIQYMNVSNRDRMFLLWQWALPGLVSQQFTHCSYTDGLRNVKGKPKKTYMHACTFSAEVPRLCFSWRDRGEYFELKLLFRVKNKVLKPVEFNITFFISSSNEPMRFHLLNSLQDLYVMALFCKYSNCISVFKCHYEEHFKSFKEQLGRMYELI